MDHQDVCSSGGLKDTHRRVLCLLDDPLTSLDAQTQSHVMRHCVHDLLRRNSSTAVIVAWGETSGAEGSFLRQLGNMKVDIGLRAHASLMVDDRSSRTTETWFGATGSSPGVATRSSSRAIDNNLKPDASTKSFTGMFDRVIEVKDGRAATWRTPCYPAKAVVTHGRTSSDHGPLAPITRTSASAAMPSGHTSSSDASRAPCRGDASTEHSPIGDTTSHTVEKLEGRRQAQGRGGDSEQVGVTFVQDGGVLDQKEPLRLDGHGGQEDPRHPCHPYHGALASRVDDVGNHDEGEKGDLPPGAGPIADEERKDGVVDLRVSITRAGEAKFVVA